MKSKILLMMMLFPAIAYSDVLIKDLSCMQTDVIKELHVPSSLEELRAVVVGATCPIAIAGGRFSQGGQIWYQDGIVIDMTKLNKVTCLDLNNKTVTVQAGIFWKDVQKRIIPFNLSVTVMQSYNDFTVGGSLSVNAHGRDVAYGPMVDSVKSIKIMLADGSLVTASRLENYELFKGAIGGYGALGIIVEATLLLTDNYVIERIVKRMPLAEYKEFFYENIYKNPQVALHNANLYPNDYEEVLAITWYKSSKKLTICNLTMPVKNNYIAEVLAQKLLAYVPGVKNARIFMDEQLSYNDCPVVWRNYEMSATVKSLESYSRALATTILQEYFVPVDYLECFANRLCSMANDYEVNVLNVSIRYVPQDNETLLSYASQDCFSLVLFINLINTTNNYFETQQWTRELIDVVVDMQGSYYLPYHLFASPQQFQKAYPKHGVFRALKQQYDPRGRFSNSLIDKYLS